MHVPAGRISTGPSLRAAGCGTLPLLVPPDPCCFAAVTTGQKYWAPFAHLCSARRLGCVAIALLLQAATWAAETWAERSVRVGGSFAALGEALGCAEPVTTDCFVAAGTAKLLTLQHSQTGFTSIRDTWLPRLWYPVRQPSATCASRRSAHHICRWPHRAPVLLPCCLVVLRRLSRTTPMI